MSSPNTAWSPRRRQLKQTRGRPKPLSRNLMVDEVDAHIELTRIKHQPRRVMSKLGFRRMLAAERMTSWSDTEATAESKRTSVNWQRAPTLYEHYQLGSRGPGARLLHRRAQVETENYREVQTRMHSVSRVMGQDARAMTIPEFGEKSLAAEQLLHRSGHIYDPAGVERRAQRAMRKPGNVGKGFGHDMQSNFAWLLGAVHAQHDFEMVGPMSKRSLSRGSKPPGTASSALLREVQALNSAGFKADKPIDTSGVPIIRMRSPRGKPSVTMRDLDEAAPKTMPGLRELARLEKSRVYQAKVDAQPANLRLGGVKGLIKTFSKPNTKTTWHEGKKLDRTSTLSSVISKDGK